MLVCARVCLCVAFACVLCMFMFVFVCVGVRVVLHWCVVVCVVVGVC